MLKRCLLFLFCLAWLVTAGCGSSETQIPAGTSPSQGTASQFDSHPDTAQAESAAVPAASAELPDNPYSTIFEQSELRWYIEETAGPGSAAECRYYDYHDPEAAILLAVRMKNDTPSFYVHLFNAGLCDWYRYNNLLLGPLPCEQDQHGVWVVTLLPDFDPIYVRLSEDGRVDCFLSYCWTDGGERSGPAFKYSYNELGQMSGVYQFDANYKTAFLTNDYFAYGNKLLWIPYSYNTDGSLDHAIQMIRDQESTPDDWQSYEESYAFFYENGKRVLTEFRLNNTKEMLQFVRDALNRVTEAIATRNGETENSIPVRYLPGGQVEYDNGWTS